MSSLYNISTLIRFYNIIAPTIITRSHEYILYKSTKNSCSLSLLDPRNVFGREPSALLISFLASFSPSLLIDHTRAYNRIVVEHDLDFAEDKSQFVYVSFEDREFSERRFRSALRFTAVVPILRISEAIPCFVSLSLVFSPLSSLPLSLSLSPFPSSLRARRRSSVVLSSCLSARRLFHCAFALEVISKNFWRWIVPRDGNRGPTLPAAFTQTTGETTFPVGPRHGSLFGSQSAREIILGTVATFLRRKPSSVISCVSTI